MRTLHTDIPTRAQIERLLTARTPESVSIYLPTSPTSAGDAERIELKNLLNEALGQLEVAGAGKRECEAIEDHLIDLLEDDTFWRFQARSLAVFVTPDTLATFRLPNDLAALVEVSDRFHLKPLMRSVTFPQTAFVLALAQGSVRLLEVVADIEPTPIDVPGMPADVASAVGKSSVTDRSPARRIQGDEGLKVRMRQFARQVDQALRPVLSGSDVPLILAATDPLDSIFRSVCHYPHLAATTLAGNPEAATDAELMIRARAVLDELHAAALADLHGLFDQRASHGRTATDVAEVARYATQGAVDTVFVDLDELVPGFVDEATGAVTFEDTDDAFAYGVVDEIARRVWLNGGRVLAVRAGDVPGDGAVAAILRYPV